MVRTPPRKVTFIMIAEVALLPDSVITVLAAVTFLRAWRRASGTASDYKHQSTPKHPISKHFELVCIARRAWGDRELEKS